MELFNERKNKQFECIENIINDIVSGNDYTEKDIIKLIREYGFNEPDTKLEKNILNKNNEVKNNLNLIEKRGDKFYPVINSKIQIRPSNMELYWLKIMIEDPSIKYHLDERILDKLRNKLKKFEKECNLDFWIKENIDKNEMLDGNDNLIKNIDILKNAILNEKFIKYTSTDKNGKRYENKVGFPFKIEYSVRNNKYWILVLIKDDSSGDIRMIKIIISNIEKLELDDSVNYDVRDEILKFYKEKKNKKKPLILEVEDKNNAVDRCFYLFSHYDKEAYYDKERNKHILKIYYYDFDRGEIIKDILSLGSCVIVVEPEDIRNKIIERIKRAIE